MKTLRRLPLIARDGLIAGAFLVVALTAVGIAVPIGWYPYDLPSVYVVVGVAAVALFASRRFPLATLLFVTVVVVWPTWGFDIPELRVLPLLFAAYRGTAAGLRLIIALPVAVVATVIAVLPGLFAVLPFIVQFGDPLDYFVNPSRRILAGVFVIAGVLLGAAAHRQKRAANELRKRNAELGRLHAADRERIAAEERAAIARDIHDIVAHHVSAMVIRAQAADRVADTRPDELRIAVRGIAADGREALTAMRGAVRVLRSGAVDASNRLPLAEALEAVSTRVRDAGIEVHTDITNPGHLTEFEESAILRIAQEAMANVMLHARAAKVELVLESRGDMVHLQVVNDGGLRDEAHPGDGGNGVRGMRERANALGGTLEAGPVAGGWQVSARLPLAHGVA